MLLAQANDLVPYLLYDSSDMMDMERRNLEHTHCVNGVYATLTQLRAQIDRRSSIRVS